MKKFAVLHLIFLTIFAAAFSTNVFAHGDRPHNFAEVWQYWGKDPITIIFLALSAILYILGVRRLWREAATGKGIRKWEALVFAAGWISLFVALLSPLHPLGEVLFSAHMTQHEILMLVSAPLLVLGRPLIAFLWALPINWRHQVGGWSKVGWFRKMWRTISNPLWAWAIHLVALWIWHLPVLFQATLKSDFVHFLQHFSFLASALLFWWALIHGAQGLLGYGAAVLYVFSTAAHSGLLGALLTLATTVIYPAYAETAPAFGLTALEDQQLGGLIMWIPAGVLYTIAGLALLAGWLREAEIRAAKREANDAYSRKLIEGRENA
jgi:cytochrome c oxidase assembly factor CtaG